MTNKSLLILDLPALFEGKESEWNTVVNQEPAMMVKYDRELKAVIIEKPKDDDITPRQ